MTMTAAASGYAHRRYAESFAQWGTPRCLERSGGWIIERSIPDSPLRDAMGCYPIFTCRDWSGLAADFEALGDELVSLALVADPFADCEESTLRAAFDVVAPFKEHYVTRLPHDGELALPRRHRRNVARARDHVHVEQCEAPLDHLEEWVGLYAQLAERHAIGDLRALSPDAFAAQLQTPGLVMLRATAGHELAGIHLWYVQGDVAYGHLGATSAVGYELMASYALYAFAAEQLRTRVQWLALGAAAGPAADDEAGAGLRRFKRGWATETRTAYLCGRVFRPDDYDALARTHASAGASYFPAYRAGELST